MLTLGIDLASQEAATAACFVDWARHPAGVHEPEVGVSDERLLDLAPQAEKTGIDSPFGWPDDFVDALVSYRDSIEWTEASRPLLCYRETDRFVTLRARRPLSVSTDRIGVTAMRCALLLARLDSRGVEVDRSGLSGKVVEVYPAAALVAWGLDPRGYKRGKGRERRAALFDELAGATTPWLDLSAEVREVCRDVDHAFDALVASLVARAAAKGLTEPPSEELLERARREGWIHLPMPGSLAALASI